MSQLLPQKFRCRADQSGCPGQYFDFSMSHAEVKCQVGAWSTSYLAGWTQHGTPLCPPSAEAQATARRRCLSAGTARRPNPTLQRPGSAFLCSRPQEHSNGEQRAGQENRASIGQGTPSDLASGNLEHGGEYRKGGLGNQATLTESRRPQSGVPSSACRIRYESRSGRQEDTGKEGPTTATHPGQGTRRNYRGSGKAALHHGGCTLSRAGQSELGTSSSGLENSPSLLFDAMITALSSIR